MRGGRSATLPALSSDRADQGHAVVRQRPDQAMHRPSFAAITPFEVEAVNAAPAQPGASSHGERLRWGGGKATLQTTCSTPPRPRSVASGPPVHPAAVPTDTTSTHPRSTATRSAGSIDPKMFGGRTTAGFGRVTEIFGDTTIASAILDRLL